MEFEITNRPRFFFAECARIPHGSKNEKELSDYIVAFAKEHGLKYKQDDMYNVIVYKEGSKGYENAGSLILQAHIDMVCEKNKDCDHDFEKDPLKLYVEDNILRAKGTTLGADDCTGVAYMLAILEDDTLAHPPLECIFTVQEEIGLLGAMNLKAEDIYAHRMISLDGGGETTTMLSSAGGCQCNLTKKLAMEKNSAPTYAIHITGLSGGHSGGEIHKEKGNANQLAIRVVKEAILKGANIQIVSYDGGLKDNAIPREADIVFASDTPKEQLQTYFEISAKEIATELEFSDAGFTLKFEEVAVAPYKAVQKDSDDLIDYAYLMPNGFQHRSMAIEGLTLTSLNLGVVTTKNDQVEFIISVRSAIESGIDNLVNILSVLAQRLDFDMQTSARYPGWNYNEVSSMREIYKDAVKKLYDQELEMVAGHGGCECGVFCSLVPDMDIISLGPVSAHVHTPDEQLDLESFDRTYQLLCTVVSAVR